MTGLLPVAEALSRLLHSGSPKTGSEMVSLHEAGGRVLASDLSAKLTQPPFDNSAMDGYAVRADDLENGLPLRVTGEAAAGLGAPQSLGPGEAIRIFTGAPVPDGADTVLIQENALVNPDGTITATSLPVKGRNIRPKGQDFMQDQVLLRQGQILDAGHLTLAAAMNYPCVPVYRKPIVGILATGNELLSPGSQLGPGQIIGSNTFGVAEIAREAGANVIDLGICPDRTDAIMAAVGNAQAQNVDILVTLGGASVGDHDLVQSSLRQLGMTLDFWRIAMRPGKPLMVGKLDGMHVLGLPGNPASSLVCSYLFLEPLIRRVGSLPGINRLQQAVAGIDLPANDGRQDYIRSGLTSDSSGRGIATPFLPQDSSMMRIFAHADCLLVRTPFETALAQGDSCTIFRIKRSFSI